MADLEVFFVHPTTDARRRARVDDTMTGQEVIDDLVRGGFIVSSRIGYVLVRNDGELIQHGEALSSAGVSDGDVMRVIPVDEAGGYVEPIVVGPRGFAMPGLTKSSRDQVSVKKLLKSPEAIILLLHQHDELQRRYELKVKELEIERIRSSSRFTAALLLLVSQLILAIGGNLLTVNKSVAALVLVAGGLQAMLALYLSFRKPNDKSSFRDNGDNAVEQEE